MDATNTFDPRESIGFQCMLTLKLFTETLKQQLKGTNITPSQFRALACIMALDGLTQVELAELLSITPPSVVKLIDRMQQDGWIRREPHPRDRRAKRLVATPQAGRAWQGLSKYPRAILKKAYRDIPYEEIDHIRRTLNKIRQNLAETKAGN